MIGLKKTPLYAIKVCRFSSYLKNVKVAPLTVFLTVFFSILTRNFEKKKNSKPIMPYPSNYSIAVTTVDT